VKRFHDYNTFHGLETLKDIVAKQDPSMSEELMKALFPLRNKKIGQTLQDIINRFESSAEYATPQDWFAPKKFNTFMEYFTRKLTEKKTKEIESKIDQFSMVMPSESNIESIGDFSDTSSILRLKKPTKDVVKDLIKVGIVDVQLMEYISLKLLKCYYHRVHCPVSGTIQKITFVGTEEPLFGDNSLWVVEFNSEFGRVYMLVVGELSIQDFNFKHAEGDKVNKFYELGNFNWCSQLVVIFEKDSFKGMDVLIREKEKFFVGDGIFPKREMKINNWEAMPNTNINRNDMGTGTILAPGVTSSPNDSTIF
jgi:phosphatidylserine decarboxylase